MPQKTEKTRKIHKITDCFIKKGMDGGNQGVKTAFFHART